MGSLGVPNISISRSRPKSSCCGLNLQFLQTVQGNLKIFQLLIGGVCESLLVTYGMSNSSLIGGALTSLLSATSSCIWTTSLLLFCYIFSPNSYALIRSSLFEVVFSLLACLSFLSASLYTWFSVKLYLYPEYLVHMHLFATSYPATVACYMLGFVLAILYGLDTFHAFKQYKGYH